MRSTLGAPAIRQIPFPAAYAAALLLCVVPSFLRPRSVREITPRVIREYKFGHRYDTGKAKRLLGFSASVIFREAIREMLAAYEKEERVLS